MSRYLVFAIPLGIILLFALMFYPPTRRFAQGILIWSAVLFLASAALVPFFIGLRSIWRGLASTHWPTASATVLKAGVSETEGKVQRSRETCTMYSANLSFGYKVNGRDYSTETIQYGKALGSGDFSEAAVLLLQYPPGASVEIRHHPTDPSIATVKPGVNGEVVLYLVAGIVFLAFGAVAGLGCYVAVTKDMSVLRYAFSLAWLIMVFLELGMLGPGLQDLWRARASSSWPKTRGVIVFADTEAETVATGTSDGQVLRSTTHSAALAHQYEV